jgi:hypothetical protein
VYHSILTREGLGNRPQSYSTRIVSIYCASEYLACTNFPVSHQTVWNLLLSSSSLFRYLTSDITFEPYRLLRSSILRFKESLTLMQTPGSFEIDDVEENWAYNEKFDFIHARIMTGR